MYRTWFVTSLLSPLHCVSLAACVSPFLNVEATAEDDSPPVLFEEDFESGIDRWRVLDPGSWRLNQSDGNTTFEIVSRQSDYKPKVRSPLHLALIADNPVGNFELTFRVRSTKDTGGHRDCCVIFGFEDPTHFYYVHLGAKPDRVSGQLSIVNGAAREPVTQNDRPIPWDDKWHTVKVRRTLERDRLQVFFDDMDVPHLEAETPELQQGLVGIGSFDDCDEFDDVLLRAK